MGRRGLFILVAVLLILSALGVVAVLFLNRPGPDNGQVTGEPTATEVLGATAVPTVGVLYAALPIERGQAIPTEAIGVYPWPVSYVPPGAIFEATQIVGSHARYAIQQGEPILASLVVTSLLQLSPAGSDAAARIPPGQLAISLPYNKKDGVSLGVRDGDHVDVIVSWALVDIDQNFQTALPNLTTLVSPPNPDAVLPIPPSVVAVANVALGPFGRGEGGVNIGEDFYVIPSETTQRPRYVSQSIIQNAIVLHLGDFGEDKPVIVEPTLTPDPTQGASPVPPTPTPLPPETITLIVSPQDALVLNFVKRMMEVYPFTVQMTLVLRSPLDSARAERIETESVTLQYMFENYNIALPAKLNYGPGGAFQGQTGSGQPAP